jgi:hypothetical protein
MDKSLAGLIGAVGVMAAVSPSQAATNMAPSLDDVMHVNSYADLLKPIPNAVAMKQAFDEAQSSRPAEPEVLTIQYYHHHHHHHHHRYYRRYYHHHHHHHHHRGIRIGPVVIR